jgi:phosphatidylglycerol---prolipoprotein diacylglyceryl transferase
MVRGPNGLSLTAPRNHVTKKGFTVPKFTWDIDPALFHLGSWELRYYSLIFVVVFLGGYQLLRWQIMRGGGEERDASDFFVYGVLAVLIGARLGHCFFYDYEKTFADPFWVLQIWTGGLSSHGAVIGLIIAMWRFTKSRGIPFLEGADRFAFSAALGAMLVRIGNFFNSEIVGRITDGTWGVKFPRYDRGAEVFYRHPTQLYEAAVALTVLGSLFLADRLMGKERRYRGMMISLFFILYFTGRFGIEYFKEIQVEGVERTSATFGLSMGQLLSVPCILLGVYGIFSSLKKKEPVGWISDDETDEDEFDDPPEDGEDSVTDTDKKDDDASKKLFDKDVADEFSLSAEERRELTRKEAQKED